MAEFNPDLFPVRDDELVGRVRIDVNEALANAAYRPFDAANYLADMLVIEHPSSGERDQILFVGAAAISGVEAG